MLGSIKDALVSILDFLSSIVDFVVGFIKDTINFLVKIPEAVSNVSDMATSFFPPQILALFVAALAIVVILRIVGRD